MENMFYCVAIGTMLVASILMGKLMDYMGKKNRDEEEADES